MSHFCTLVLVPSESCRLTPEDFKKQVEKQLAPFQENNKGDCPEQYLEFVDLEEEFQKEYETGSVEMIKLPNGKLVYRWDDMFRVPGQIGFGTETHKVPDNLERVQVAHKDRFSTLEEFAESWHSATRDKKKKRFGYWENPNEKWDWWQIGGRYTGRYVANYDPEEDPDNQETCWLCNGTGKRTDMKVENGCNGCNGTGIAIKYPTEWQSKGDIVPTSVVIQLIQIDGQKHTPFAVLTPDGKWYERGEMGWWAVVFDEKDKDEHQENVLKILKEHSNTVAVVVDCHI